jgi:hypothetical protein
MNSSSRAWSKVPAAIAGVLIAIAFSVPTTVSSQGFGQNKVQFDKFNFQVLKTQHFDIYYYPAEETAARTAARMAERWYSRLSRLLTHELTGRQPLILYASHPHFQQTNVIDSMIGEGTGGVTEGLQRRITLPLGATLELSDHVIGHELVHAFQYDILGPAVGAVPLWFIEGMAEYLAVGPRDPLTAMWLRDAAITGKLPGIDDLDDPDYFPYRWGQALWAYLAGRWGDSIVSTSLKNIVIPGGRGGEDPIDVIEAATGMDEKSLSSAWHAAIREMADVPATRTTARPTSLGPNVIGGTDSRGGTMNIAPALSPDGTKIAFLSEKGQLSIDLYVAETVERRNVKKVLSTTVDPHFQSLQFLMSAGTWHPTQPELAIGAVRKGQAILAIIDTDRGGIDREIRFDDIDEIFQPAWSPDGNRIAFSGQAGGVTDLYVYDVQSGRTDRLTNDEFADLQPAWSPDGRTLVFVTDRFTTRLDNLTFGDYRLAIATPGGGAAGIQAINFNLAGNTTNPHFLQDGRTVVFLSDATGRPEVYSLDRDSGRVSRVAGAMTGVAGITALSPALSVSSKSSKVAYTVFRDRGYDIHVTNWDEITPTAPATGRDLAVLPPASRQSSDVASLIANPTAGLPAATTFTTEPYKARMSLVGVGQQVGVATTSAFGSYVSGGIAFTFSDVLGNHLLGTSFGVNGGLRDISAQALYVDRRSRWNWGVFGDRVPFLTGSVAGGFVEQGGDVFFVQEINRIRQTYQQVGLFTAYPFSRAMRAEFTVSGQHIGFDREIETVIFDALTGSVLSEDTTRLPSPSSIRLAGAGGALVYDTSIFGATGPILGQRWRFDVQPTFGDLRMMNVALDYRPYAMPFRPVTFAARLMHIGRYGDSAEDSRLTPLFLGYPDVVRGYHINSFDEGECEPTPTGSCAAFDRLLGSRIVVGNFEVRAPLVGLFKGRLDYGAVPVDIFGFADAGTAWLRGESPTFAGGTRGWVTSAGFGARVNVFGFAVAEFNMVRPLNRPGRGWMYVFNLRPGW